jgi:hypothetical protein
MCGYQTTVQCIKDLSDDLTKFLAASKQDDSADADGNGKADVLEMTPQQLVTHKTLLFLKTVDPNRITNALAGTILTLDGIRCESALRSSSGHICLFEHIVCRN